MEMSLKNEPFRRIVDGTKRVEMRLNDKKRQSLKVGDIIRFTNIKTLEVIEKEVEDLKVYPSFKELYEAYPKEYLGYLENEEASYTDMNHYYHEDEIRENGVLAISLK